MLVLGGRGLTEFLASPAVADALNGPRDSIEERLDAALAATPAAAHGGGGGDDDHGHGHGRDLIPRDPIGLQQVVDPGRDHGSRRVRLGRARRRRFPYDATDLGRRRRFRAGSRRARVLRAHPELSRVHRQHDGSTSTAGRGGRPRNGS
jgi:hypothetical protein